MINWFSTRINTNQHLLLMMRKVPEGAGYLAARQIALDLVDMYLRVIQEHQGIFHSHHIFIFNVTNNCFPYAADKVSILKCKNRQYCTLIRYCRFIFKDFEVKNMFCIIAKPCACFVFR